MLISSFHAPTKPYSIIDAHNRRACATGSPAYARAASSADYNGHRGDLSWNDYRGYYIGSYRWAGLNYIVRTRDLTHAIGAVLEWYTRQGRGASLAIAARECDAHLVAPFVEAGDLIESTPDALIGDMAWHTWRHVVAARSADQRSRIIFDPELLAAASSEKDYTDTIRNGRGRLTV